MGGETQVSRWNDGLHCLTTTRERGTRHSPVSVFTKICMVRGVWVCLVERKGVDELERRRRVSGQVGRFQPR